MVSLKVHDEGSDPELKRTRKLRIQISSSKYIKTPARALNLGNSTSESRLIGNTLIEGTSIRGINEIYRPLTKELVNQIDNDRDKLEEFGKSLRYIFGRPEIENELNLLFFNYSNSDEKGRKGKNTIPTDKETRYLCNVLSYPLSDVIITPIIGGLTGEQYITFLKKFFEHLKSYAKNTPVIGFLPALAPTELRQLYEFYSKQEVFSYVMDFVGKNPIDFFFAINDLHEHCDNTVKKEYKEESFLHAFNIPITKARQKTEVAPPKDIMVFPMGFDSFSTSHIPPRINQKVLDKMKMAGNKQVFHLFGRKDYGYHRHNIVGIKNLLHENIATSIKYDDIFASGISNDRSRSLRRAFNVERHAMEAVQLRTEIKEKSTLTYLESKPHAKEPLKAILKRIK